MMTTRAAVIGFGYWANNIVRVLCDLLGAPNVLVIEPVAERRAQVGERFPGCSADASVSAAFGNADICSIFICTPSATHFSIASRALHAGKHVFVEKPAALSLEEAVALFHLVRQTGRIVFPGHVHLFSPLFAALQGQLADRALGDIRYAVGRRSSLGPRAREDTTVVWDYLIHDVYVFNRLLGGPPKSVSARGGAYLRPHIEDVAFAVLEYPENVLIDISASWYAPDKVRSLLMVGSESMLTYDDSQPNALRLCRRGYRQHEGMDRHGNIGLTLFDDGQCEIPLAANAQPLRVELETFLAMTRGEQRNDWIERHVIEVSATLEAIDRSIAAGGRSEPIEPLVARSLDVDRLGMRL